MKFNYFSFKQVNSEKYLLTNEMGFYEFLSKENFENVIGERFDDIDLETVARLRDKYFIYDQDADVFVENASYKYRDNKNYLFAATCLHIFVLTNTCNMNCVYCQAQDTRQTNKGMMDRETAKRAVDIALQSPSRELTFEFQGGEPLTNFETLKYIVEYTEAQKGDKIVHYSVVSNTLLITDEIIDFFKQNNVSLSTSLDGDEDIHNSNRPKANGEGTYRFVERNIRYMQSKNLGIGAIQTTTRKSLAKPKAIVDAYRNLDLHYLFIRPLTPLGYANENWSDVGYTAEEFIKFYRACLREIIQANKEGYRMAEGHASIFLRKMLDHVSDNYMELRSPCGAGVGQIVYYYDGKVYTCDEARMLSEMGMPDFCIGTVEKTYDELVDSRVCKVTCQSSVIECIPQCCDCVYHPYCGVCPVVNYALESNLYSREANGYRCKIYKGMLDILFEYLENDKEATEIFSKWL